MNVASTLFAGGMAGICNWAVAVPQDVLKSRLQTGMFMFTVKMFLHLLNTTMSYTDSFRFSQLDFIECEIFSQLSHKKF